MKFFSHSNGIMHRDVKPGNIMFDPDNKVLKLVDWGLAEFYHPGEPYSLYGTTRPYKAPEQLVGMEFYDYSMDMWSVGMAYICIKCEVLTSFERPKYLRYFNSFWEKFFASEK